MLEYDCAHMCEHPEGVVALGLMRIGEKIVDRDKVDRALDRLFEMRQNGASQQEAAQALGIDRTFVSRVENLGEIRKGKRVALVGFPVGNKDEIEALARRAGVDFVWLMNDAERWQYVQDRSGIELLDDLVGEIGSLKQFDAVVFLGSDVRVKLVEAIIGNKAVSMVIGKSPIRTDVTVDSGRVAAMIEAVRGGERVR
mgnify:CR=1 FL=1